VNRPAAEHGMGDLRVELEAERPFPNPNRLRRKIVARRQGLGTGGAVEAFPMPVIDVARPGNAPIAAEGLAGGRRQ
jgi:hypothetical protein